MTSILSVFGLAISVFISWKALESQIFFGKNDVWLIQLHLGFIFSVIGLAIPLFFNLIYQLSKDYSTNVAKEISNIAGLKIFLLYIFFSCGADFYLLKNSDDTLMADSSLLLLLGIISTILVLFFVVRDVHKILFLEQGLVQEYARSVIKFIHKSTPKRIIDDGDSPFGFTRLNKREMLMNSLRVWIRAAWRNFLYGTFDNKSMPFGFMSKPDAATFIDKVKVLFRMAQKSVEKDDFLETKMICREITKITKAYIAHISFYSTDEYAIFLSQESKNLFAVAAQQKNEDHLEHIVDMVGECSFAASQLKRVGMDLPSSILESVLVEFCIEGLPKKNSLATNNAILHLKQIGIHYAQRGDLQSALHTSENLIKIGDQFSSVDHIYTLKMCLIILGALIDIYFQGKIKVFDFPNPNYIEYYDRDIFNGIQKVIIKLYATNSSILYGSRPSDIFFSETNQNRSTLSYLSLVFSNPNIDLSKKEYFIYNLEEVFQGISTCAQFAVRADKDTANYGKFFFRSFELLLHFYTNEVLGDRVREKLLDIFTNQLASLFSKETGLVLARDAGHTAIYSLSFVIVGLIIKSREDESLYPVLNLVIQNLIDAFRSLNEENDLYTHKRRKIYSYILFFAGWCWKRLPDKEITDLLVNFVRTHVEHRSRRRHFGDSSRFSKDNLPEQEDFFGFSAHFDGDISSIRLSFFDSQDNTMNNEEWRQFFGGLNDDGSAN